MAGNERQVNDRARFAPTGTYSDALTAYSKLREAREKRPRFWEQMAEQPFWEQLAEQQAEQQAL